MVDPQLSALSQTMVDAFGVNFTLIIAQTFALGGPIAFVKLAMKWFEDATAERDGDYLRSSGFDPDDFESRIEKRRKSEARKEEKEKQAEFNDRLDDWCDENEIDKDDLDLDYYKDKQD